MWPMAGVMMIAAWPMVILWSSVHPAPQHQMYGDLFVQCGEQVWDVLSDKYRTVICDSSAPSTTTTAIPTLRAPPHQKYDDMSFSDLLGHTIRCGEQVWDAQSSKYRTVVCDNPAPPTTTATAVHPTLRALLFNASDINAAIAAARQPGQPVPDPSITPQHHHHTPAKPDPTAPTTDPATPALTTTTAALPATPALTTTTAAQPATPALTTTTAAQPATPALTTTTAAQPATPALTTTTAELPATTEGTNTAAQPWVFVLFVVVVVVFVVLFVVFVVKYTVNPAEERAPLRCTPISEI